MTTHQIDDVMQRPPSPDFRLPIGTTPVTPVATIGMACRLPGGIDSPEQLWEALLRGDDLVTEIPPDRWDADEYYDPEPGVPGRSVSRWGAFIDDVAGFDPEFFGINERERAGRPGAALGREDGFSRFGGRLRAYHVIVALATRSQGAGNDRAHARDRCRRRDGVRRHSRGRYGSAVGAQRPPPGFRCVAAVIEDATLTNITDDLIEHDWAPKVYGAWNLHTATAEQPLDWFCLFSSAAALVGSPGQGAYATANSWMDAFTRWRRARGLSATAIAWGAWAQIKRGTALAEGADVAIAPDEGAYAFEALLRHDRACTGYAPIPGAPWLIAFAHHRSPFAEALRSNGQSSTGTSKLRSQLDELALEEWPTRLRRPISDQVSLILRRNIDPDRPLSEYGLDSLGGLELLTRIQTEMGIRVTPADIATTGTIRGLAELLFGKLAPADAA